MDRCVSRSDVRAGVQVIRLEQKLASDAETWLYRFICDRCGRKGCYLERAEVAANNALAHKRSEHGQEVRL
jgi:hypothetical protein